jgi:hypothetical protein
MSDRKNLVKRELTAAMEGLESSPGCGCVTSAPNMMVGMSLTNGILRVSASTKTVFRPPTCPPPASHKSSKCSWVTNHLGGSPKGASAQAFILSTGQSNDSVLLQDVYLHIDLQSNIGHILFAHLINMLGQAALWHHSKHCLAMLLQVTYIHNYNVRQQQSPVNVSRMWKFCNLNITYQLPPYIP